MYLKADFFNPVSRRVMQVQNSIQNSIITTHITVDPEQWKKTRELIEETGIVILYADNAEGTIIGHLTSEQLSSLKESITHQLVPGILYVQTAGESTHRQCKAIIENKFSDRYYFDHKAHLVW